MNANELSEQLLLAVKTGQPTHHILAKLEALPFYSFYYFLDTDDRKKAFWINIYNAFFQILRSQHGLRKPDIFRKRCIAVAGQAFSLDDIEHGILRKYRLKWALGYLPDPFANGTIRKLAVSEIDYRIHFALNCGAKSCPPIAFYSHENMERQLETATLSFLEAETEILSSPKEVRVTRLFLWFKGDFARAGGVRRLLREKLNLETRTLKITYQKYDWEEALANFRSDGS